MVLMSPYPSRVNFPLSQQNIHNIVYSSSFTSSCSKNWVNRNRKLQIWEWLNKVIMTQVSSFAEIRKIINFWRFFGKSWSAQKEEISYSLVRHLHWYRNYLTGRIQWFKLINGNFDNCCILNTFCLGANNGYGNI